MATAVAWVLATAVAWVLATAVAWSTGLQVNPDGVGQQRSLKYFQGLVRGCWLVRWAWVEACAAAGQWLDETPFELSGDHFALGAPHTGGYASPPPLTLVELVVASARCAQLAVYKPRGCTHQVPVAA